VGRVVEAKLHPDAKALYVERIDLGEAAPRTVVSGLVGKVPLETLQGALVVCVVNLKPSALRGVVSEAMVLAATDAAGVTELVTPPAGSAPGSVVAPQGLKLQPDEAIDLKKSKVWESVKAKLRVDAASVATFDGTPLVTAGGPCTVASVKDAQIA
jgi:tRNA-binding EMAP/Myf-like protein